MGFVANTVLYISSLIIPPLAVYLKKGATKDLAINTGFTILGWVPGMLHAFQDASRQDDKHARTVGLFKAA
ncbi:uncharacterized protein CTHT_0036650 [Thermochaetoides thermophila DSM 1495]|uniref:Uncharacterized protein n=1 Tax=Chaetomium thermophilum (strain DSM 1495 / CBS 144.50 / IMI 039719) TaxID=759272 RepID=G0S7K6_CHATD|nr:hypothetical protein CTHT_0036650 [Thermochaetoides thermophila DSM 1495]EGS21797.1 hypothetical protein CTHT_0036650 [Thermochaetoides thermophila DSM 1495]